MLKKRITLVSNINPDKAAIIEYCSREVCFVISWKYLTIIYHELESDMSDSQGGEVDITYVHSDIV